ncbi:MAG: type II CRISPR RNA-guided endonuclease Cas9 [Anaerorhabdus sp.]
MKYEDYTVGYDLGITSIGWSLIDNKSKNLIEFGVRKFDEAEAASSARLNRSARRTLRRKKWRLNQLKSAFKDFKLLNDDFFDENGNFDTSLNRKIDDSIYHLRKRALTSEVSPKELFLSIYNIAKTRGHFLLETVDFTQNDTLTPELFYERFCVLAERFVSFIDRENFEKLVLSSIYNSHVKVNEIKDIFKNHNFVDIEEDKYAQNRLLLMVKLLMGNNINLEEIDEEIALDSISKKNIIDLKKNIDSLNDFLLEIVEIYDMLETTRILKEYSYLCEKHVDAIDSVAEIQKKMKSNPEGFEEDKKEIQKYMSVSDKKLGNKLKVVKNIQNVYPNGLYVKEVMGILKNQKKYNKKITDEFIDICCMITRARIPYYIGPLSDKAKNNWLAKNEGNFKYSYEYSAKSLIDEYETIKKWKEAMISRCTYLPQEFAMAKESFVAELFVILNELNILYAEDENEQRYYLTKDDKYRVINELFLKKSKVKFDDVKDLLNLKHFGINKSSKSSRKQFNKNFTVYHKVVNVLSDLKIDDIKTFISDNQCIDKIEKIIEVLCLYDEELGKIEYFKNTMGFSNEDAERLSRINTKDFMSLSKKFVSETPMDSDGHSLLEKLFEDNTCEYTNEQMTIINMAHDENGEKIDYSSNKYEAILNDNPELGMHLLMDENKPFIPIPRPVIRALNECFKVHSEIIKIYGTPKRVVLETAKDMKDMDLSGKEPKKYFEKMEELHKYLLDQLKEKKIKRTIEKFDQLSGYLERNRKKIELYIRQNGKCLITNNQIVLSNLDLYEMDHILPRGFGDNSMNNLLLLHRDVNKQKSNRTPIEYIRSTNGEYSERDYRQSVNDLFEMKLISEEKKNRLLLENQEDAMGFVNRNLVDTRYIVKEFTSILKAYSSHHKHNTTYVSLKAGFTSMYRYALNLYKSRNYGLQHHAHDASVIIVVDKVLSKIYPKYDSKGDSKEYREFLTSIENKYNDKRENKNARDLNKDFIIYGYKKAFGHGFRDHNSFINQVRSSTPLISYKVDRKYKGEFFNATIRAQSKKNLKAPLNVLGINDDKRDFSSINCAAVDFYKITNKKGKKKHFSVHIPKVIVNDAGMIDQKKYLTLIKEHYKYKELLDVNGELIKGAFRLRMRKGDIFYDTQFKQPMYYNIGSIADKSLEKKIVTIFSYDDVIKLMDEVIFKYKNDIRDKDVSDDDVKKEVESYLFSEVLQSNEKYDKFFGAIKSELYKEETNIYECIKNACYLAHLLIKMCLDDLPSKINDRNRPVVNRNGLEEDAQYVKVVYSPLGIRYNREESENVSEDGELIRNINLRISGPKNGGKHFKLIKKEEFTWQL